MQKFKNNQQQWVLYDLHPGFTEATLKILVPKRKGQRVSLNSVPIEWRCYKHERDVSCSRFWFTIQLPTFEWKILESLREIKIQKTIDFSQAPQFVSSELLRILN